MVATFLQEWFESGVSESIILANVEPLSGQSALEFCTEYAISKIQKQTSFVGVQANRILDRYQHVSEGGWLVRGLDPLNNWQRMSWGQFKPVSPRLNEDGKPIKYHSPEGIEARAIFLDVPEKPAYWAQVQNSLETVFVCEGAKKAGLLLTLGYAAIAIPGIWMATRKNELGVRSLIPEIANFAKTGRKFVFVFDQDAKAKTQRSVIQAQWATAQVLQQQGCECFTTIWDQAEGKGIDDVWATAGGDLIHQILNNFQALQKPLEPGEPDPKAYREWCDREIEQQTIEDTQHRQTVFATIAQRLKEKPRLGGFGFKPLATVASTDIVEVSSHQEGHFLADQMKARLIVNLTGTGGKKTTFYSNTTPEFFGSDRVFAVLPDALNPSVESFTDWAFLEGRHLGTVYDRNDKVRRATPDTPDYQKVDPSNCDKAFAINLMRDHNLINPAYMLACLNCQHNWRCGKESGDGYGARYQASLALKQPRIRLNYGRLHGAGEESALLAKSTLILDESSSHVETEEVITVCFQDLKDKYVQVDRSGDASLQSLKPLLDYLLSDDWKRGDRDSRIHGINQAKLAQRLAQYIPQEIDWQALERLEDDSEELKAFGFKPSEQPLSDKELRRLKKLEELRELPVEQYREFQMLQGLEAHSKDQKRRLQTYRKYALTPELEQERDALRSRYEATRRENLSASELRTRAAFLTKRWLRDFLLVLTGSVGHIHWGKEGITLTMPKTQHLAAIQSAQKVVLSDASELRTKADLSTQYGIPEEKIFIFQVKQPKGGTVETIHIQGLGKLGKNRGGGLEQSRQMVVATLKELDPTHKTFDWKLFEADGVLFRDTVGSNDYKGCKSISTTIPRPSMNAMLAKYCIQHRVIVDTDDPGFKAFYQRRIKEALLQTRGRLREQLRPGEKLTFYVMGDDDLPIEGDRIIQAIDLNPQAGKKGEKSIRAIAQAAKQVLEKGQALTQSAVARMTAFVGLKNGKGYTQQAISKVWNRVLEVLQLFLGSPYKKSCSLPPPDIEKVDSIVPIVEEIAQTGDPTALDEVILWLSPYEWAITLERLTESSRNILLQCWLSLLPREVQAAIA